MAKSVRYKTRFKITIEQIDFWHEAAGPEKFDNEQKVVETLYAQTMKNMPRIGDIVTAVNKTAPKEFETP